MIRAIALVCFASLGAACAERGAASAEQAAMSYLAAARRGDVSAIIGLTPTHFDAEDAARAKVAIYAPVRDLDLEIQYKPNEMLPTIVVVDVVSNDRGFRDSVAVQLLERRWYLTIGRSKIPALPVPTAQPTVR